MKSEGHLVVFNGDVGSEPPPEPTGRDINQWAFVAEPTDVRDGKVTFRVYFWSGGTPVPMTNWDLYMKYDGAELSFNSERYPTFGGPIPPAVTGVLACRGAGLYNAVTGIYTWQRYTGYTDRGLSMCDGLVNEN